MQVAVLSDETRTVDASVEGDRVVVRPEDLPAALGWELRPEGLCRDDVCVPVRDRSSIEAGDGIDVAAAAGALGCPSVVSAADGVVAVGRPATERRQAIADMVAVPFSLPDLDGTVHHLGEWAGKKKLLVVFASW